MKSLKTFALAAVAALWLAAPAQATPVASDNPKVVIETTINQIIDVLNARTDKTRVTPEEREKIRQIVAGVFDYTTMAKRSLGQPWRDLDAAEQKHFASIFQELLELTYGNRLSEYKGQTVTYGNPEFKGDRARVMSTVSDGNKSTPVEYRLHKTPSGWEVYDIRIEGASLILTFYQDFQNALQNGSYQDLVKSLQQRIAKLKARDQA